MTDTATTEEKKWEWFKKIDLAQFVDVIVCSSVTGYTKDQKEAYEEVLRKLNIKHGHLHDGNFCVEFHQGKIRLYVIDFDEALS